MSDKPSFGSGPSYDTGVLTAYVQQFFERFRAIEAQLAVISEKLGIPYENPADAVPAEISELVHAGKRVEALVRYRELTGASIDEARRVIAQL